MCIRSKTLVLAEHNLKLNSDKSDFALVETQQRLKKSSAHLRGSCRLLRRRVLQAKGFRGHAEQLADFRAPQRRKLAIFTFARFAAYEILSAMMPLRQRRCIVGSRIDRFNAQLFKASGRLAAKLQRVQENLARLVFDVSIRNLHDWQKRVRSSS